MSNKICGKKILFFLVMKRDYKLVGQNFKVNWIFKVRFKRDCKGCLKKHLSGLNRRYRIRDATKSYAVGGEILNLHLLITRWLIIRCK